MADSNPRRQRLRKRFIDLAQGPDEALKLIEAALLIGAEAQPEADLPGARDALRRLVAEAGTHIPAAAALAQRTRALVRYLRQVKGYCGNDIGDLDPGHSYLHQVLTRRSGLPITLALLYLHVGRGVGLPVHGIGFPGHFLVGVGDPGAARTVLDPFNGQVLDEAGIRILAERHTVPAEHLAAALQAIPDRLILVRILNNLRVAHQRAGAFEAALDCCDRALLLTPDNLGERAMRAALCEHMGAPAAAAQELQWLLPRVQDGAARSAIREKLVALQRSPGPTLH